MLRLDHLTVIAPTLAAGVTHVRDCLGIEMPDGGKHPEMGTHNRVVRIDPHAYLEVIAADPDAQPPSGPQWMGFGQPATIAEAWSRGDRLRGFVAATTDIETLLAAHKAVFGCRTRISRNDRHSWFTVPPNGELPLGGAMPSAIDREGRAPPFTRMKDIGLRLKAFVLEHPEPDDILDMYRAIGLVGAPSVIAGPRLRFTAMIETPSGLRQLT